MALTQVRPAAAPPDTERATVLWPDENYPPDSYPSMPVSQDHVVACIYVYTALVLHHKQLGHPTAIASDLEVYANEGDRHSVCAPDILVAHGIELHGQSSYRIWAARKPPDLVLEIASESTWQNDAGDKRDLYARLGIREYWQYDPTGGEWLGAPLIGWVLGPAGYDLIPPLCHEGVECYPSAVLQMKWGVLTLDQVQALEPGLTLPQVNLRLRLLASDGTWYPVHPVDPEVRAQYEEATATLAAQLDMSRSRVQDLENQLTASQQNLATVNQEIAELKAKLRRSGIHSDNGQSDADGSDISPPRSHMR